MYVFYEEDFIDKDNVTRESIDRNIDNNFNEEDSEIIKELFDRYVKDYYDEEDFAEDIDFNIVPQNLFNEFRQVDLTPTVADIFNELLFVKEKGTPKSLYIHYQYGSNLDPFQKPIFDNVDYLYYESLNLYAKLIRAYYFGYKVLPKEYMIKIPNGDDEFLYYVGDGKLRMKKEKEDYVKRPYFDRIDKVKNLFQTDFPNIQINKENFVQVN